MTADMPEGGLTWQAAALSCANVEFDHRYIKKLVAKKWPTTKSVGRLLKS
jgi:hypothetical protein